MTRSQRWFRRLALAATLPAGIATVMWLAQTPLQPFYGFILIPALILTALAAGSWLYGKLAATGPARLALTCGDAKQLVKRSPGRCCGFHKAA